jgi:glucose-6-phosphate 1-dehydrogenase
VQKDERELYEKFLKLNFYIAGSYDKSEDFEHLSTETNKITDHKDGHRFFYLALPPSVYGSVSELISKHCRPES